MRREVVEAGRRASDAEIVVARLGGAPVGIGVIGDRSREELVAEASAALVAADEASAASLAAADAAAGRGRRARRARAAAHEARRRPAATARWAPPAGSPRCSNAPRRSRRGGRHRCARVSTQAPPAAGELGATLRRLGAAEVEARQAVDQATDRVTAVEVELARLDGEARRCEAAPRRGARGAGADAAEEVGPDEGAGRDELVDPRHTTRGASRGSRQGQPAREGGVRGGEGAPRRARDAARRPRGVARGARGPARRADRDRQPPLRRDLRRGRRELRGGRGDAVPRRRGTAPAGGAERRGRRRASSPASRWSYGRQARRSRA